MRISKAVLVYQVMYSVVHNGAGNYHIVAITAERDLEDCVAMTLYSMDSSMGDLWGEAAMPEVAGYVFGKIGEATTGGVGTVLSLSMSVASLAMDMKESHERSIAINGAVSILNTSQAVDALGISAGVMSITGTEENSVVLICPKYDPEELYVRVHVYNTAHPEAPLTPEEVKEAFTNGSEELNKYLDWYYEEGGGKDTREYWGELEKILIMFCEQNPGVVSTDSESMNLTQLQELVEKKNNPFYEIDTEIMKGE